MKIDGEISSAHFVYPLRLEASARAHGSRPLSALDIRERLEYEALHAGDSQAQRPENAARARRQAGRQGHVRSTPVRPPPGTLILEPESGPEPESGSEHRYRLMLRVRGGIEHVADSLKPADAVFLIGSAIGLVEFDEDEIRAAKRRLDMPADNEVNQESAVTSRSVV
jgi:hypothetical protein